MLAFMKAKGKAKRASNRKRPRNEVSSSSSNAEGQALADNQTDPRSERPQQSIPATEEGETKSRVAGDTYERDPGTCGHTTKVNEWACVFRFAFRRKGKGSETMKSKAKVVLAALEDGEAQAGKDFHDGCEPSFVWKDAIVYHCVGAKQAPFLHECAPIIRAYAEGYAYRWLVLSQSETHATARKKTIDEDLLVVIVCCLCWCVKCQPFQSGGLTRANQREEKSEQQHGEKDGCCNGLRFHGCRSG
jgi:hypothetical protein